MFRLVLAVMMCFVFITAADAGPFGIFGGRSSSNSCAGGQCAPAVAVRVQAPQPTVSPPVLLVPQEATSCGTSQGQEAAPRRGFFRRVLRIRR